ncbi:TraB/GumN family protein [Rhodovulum sp. DZ06]|uniref:TraB/GumN family protein n=1 Tax=Rhodovulum sp. DZ06 TaxID=3425126 RepID=UPI003D325A5C
MRIFFEKTSLRRSIRAAALGLGALALLAPGGAQAECAGVSMLPQLAQERPADLAAARAAAARIPNSEGLFWRIEAPGRAPSWLLGTFHAPASEGVTPPGAALAALDRAERLLVEISAEEQAAMQAAIASDPTLIVDMSGGTLDDLLPDSARRALDAALRGYGADYESMRRLKPWFVQLMIAVPPCALAAMQAGEPVMDDALTARAEAAGTPVQGMESWRQSLSFFTGMTRQEAADGLLAAIAFADRAEDLRATMVELYRAERIYMFWELSRLVTAELVGAAESDQMHEEMWEKVVVDRNLDFRDAALPALRRGGAFIAVGALHLPGRRGMVELLRAEGMTVTRAPLN